MNLIVRRSRLETPIWAGFLDAHRPGGNGWVREK
jgi:hypothetical protein